MANELVNLASNLGLIEEMYERYRKDRESVDPSWRALFTDGDASVGAALARVAAPAATPAVAPRNVWPLVHAYRVRGHLAADLDPLHLLEHPRTVELEPSTYGLTSADMDRVFDADGLHGVSRATLAEILARLRAVYCGSIGIEFMHISSPVKQAWLAERMEMLPDRSPLAEETRLKMLDLVVAAETLERFCHTKYPGTKRFSLEGSEGLVPLLELALLHGARLGAIEAVLGMAHRGRLNILAQIMERNLAEIFAEFEDVEPEAAFGGGDVKYHLGYSCDRIHPDGNHMHVSLTFNPSHLEAVDPVVVGRVRAKQRRHGDWQHRRVMGILIHGDAAFAGQGLVPETLNLMNLHGYRTGGTVHVIVNNQIGFTATAQEARSTAYCTDVAKMVQVPIFHVNGDDLDAVARVVEIAMEYRAQFQTDVVIDMLCYRKFGHNEMDEPSFTQPVMYERIQQMTPVHELYGAKLVDEGIVDQDTIDAIAAREREDCERGYEEARKASRRPRIPSMRGIWSSYRGGADAECPEVDTGVSVELLDKVTQRMTTLPEGLTPHRKVARLLDRRRAMGEGAEPIDWGCAELLAYGTLLWDGVHVRISGQDSSRGTFSHRHAAVVDIETGAEHMLLNHLHAGQGYCRIYDSPLSEAGVLGFEFGYSLDFPDGLVIWEAQFGDFANGAQVILDQFISSSEDKWNRLAGVTLYLPHGYEGQGPEHSSARIERFLAAAAEDNMQLVQPTTAGQMFHLIRRQVARPYRKPLIVFTPKRLLRLPDAAVDREILTRGRFQRVLADPHPPAAGDVTRVLMCTGKLFYELADARKERDDRRSAILRLEQLYPWRDELVREAVEVYPNAEEIVWVQDEPSNMGAGFFVRPRLEALFGHDRVRIVDRPESASPATGSHKAHDLEQRILIDEAFGEEE